MESQGCKEDLEVLEPRYIEDLSVIQTATQLQLFAKMSGGAASENILSFFLNCVKGSKHLQLS